MSTPMAAARRRARGDDGVGLIEVLMTITLMSMAFVAILGALFVVIRTSRTHEVRADTNTVLVGAAEAVKAADFCDPADSCDPVTDYEAHLDAVDLPTGWTRAALHVTTPIVPDTTSGRLVQNVTVEVVSPNGDITQTMTVAKTAPPPPPPPTIPDPTTVCDATTVTAEAFWLFFGFVLVEADIPADVNACATPMRAHVVGGPTTDLRQTASQPTRWWGVVAAWECLAPSCQIELLQGNGALVMSVPVESWL